jgi:DNA polymerase-1
MINIHKKLPKDADLILQIHDELIVECSQEDAKKVGKIVKDEMEKVHKFDVPIEVEVHHGTSWGSLK